MKHHAPKPLPFCAICTDEIDRDPPLQDAVGRGGALVNVCDDCATKPPRAYDATRGYEVLGSVSVSKKAAARMQELLPTKANFAPTTLARSATPGWILIRVRRRARYATRDLQAARLVIPKKWRTVARYLGTAGQHFLFERPDLAAMAKARTPERDLLAELADLARPRSS